MPLRTVFAETVTYVVMVNVPMMLQCIAPLYMCTNDVTIHSTTYILWYHNICIECSESDAKLLYAAVLTMLAIIQTTMYIGTYFRNQ